MLNSHKINYVILTVGLTAGTISILGHNGGIQNGPPSREQKQLQSKVSQGEDGKKHFPTADFNEEGPSEIRKREAFKDKQKRHNGLGLVDRNPSANTGGAVFLPDGQFDF